jgi:hypothetical protein
MGSETQTKLKISLIAIAEGRLSTMITERLIFDEPARTVKESSTKPPLAVSILLILPLALRILRGFDPETGRLGRVFSIYCERETMNMDV